MYMKYVEEENEDRLGPLPLPLPLSLPLPDGYFVRPVPPQLIVLLQTKQHNGGARRENTRI